MARFIIKLTDKETKKDYYLDYSTVVEAPVTFGMTLEDFKEYYVNEYGVKEASHLNEKLERVEKNGCSGHYPFNSLKEVLFDDEQFLLEKYCLNRY